MNLKGRKYRSLKRQTFKSGSYKIVPIRFEDRKDIMKWRNEQLYHLRQNKLLTEEDQDNYYNNIVSNLFDEEYPSQLLFSLLKNDHCIGYGGLVHIDWDNKNSEISFLMNTELEHISFNENWSVFLSLIEQIAFLELKMHKIYVYAFDLRPQLYNTLESNGFFLDGRLTEHCYFDEKYLDIVIHCKMNKY